MFKDLQAKSEISSECQNEKLIRKKQTPLHLKDKKGQFHTKLVDVNGGLT